MSVSDIASLGGAETVTLSLSEGATAITASYSLSLHDALPICSVSITGTLAQINALLNTDATSTVSYSDNTDTPAKSTTLKLWHMNIGNDVIGLAMTSSDTTMLNTAAMNDEQAATIKPTSYTAA